MSLDKQDLPIYNFKPSVQFHAIEHGSHEYDLIAFGFLSMICEDNDLNNSANFIEVQGNLSHKIMLHSRIRQQNNYEKQQGSIIIWGDSEIKQYRQLAISFESNKACDFFWRLICEKIGKNYLNISGRDPLNMPREDNLPYVLDRTIHAKDLVQYHILNSNEFFLSLHKVFLLFQERSNKKGLTMIGRILNSILANVDHMLVQVLFSDPLFDIILDIQKFVHGVDFPKLWRDTMKIKNLTCLTPEVNKSVQIYHRVYFYRENILDYNKQFYLEHFLTMTHAQCCKEIVSSLAKDSTIDNLLQMKHTPNELASLDKQQEEETYSSEAEAIRRKQFCEKQMQFLIEVLVICRQMQSKSTRSKFLDKIYQANVIDAVKECMELNIVKSMDLLTCIAQIAPLRFIDYLKSNYQQQPSQGIYVKLLKKFYYSGEEFQLAIIQILKSLRESFLVKENIDFFASTFLAFNFQIFQEQKGLLILLYQSLEIVSNITEVLQCAMKNNVFSKLASFCFNQRQDKQSELRIGKIIKLILKATVNNSLQNNCGDEVNHHIVESGFFECSMKILERNIRHNNMISSSLLENLKILSSFKKITPFHSHLQLYYSGKTQLQKYLQPILSFMSAFKQPDNRQKMEEELQPTAITNNDIMIPQAKIEPQIEDNAGERYKRIREDTGEFANIQTMSKKIKIEGNPVPSISLTKQIGQLIEGNQ